MRLSEAINLGRNMVRLNPHRWLGPDWYNNGKVECGCLIGQGMVGAGLLPAYCEESDEMPAVKRWPWLLKERPVPYGGLPGETMPAIDIISGLASRVYRGRMTHEQAVDWIRSQEPEEPTDPMEPTEPQRSDIPAQPTEPEPVTVPETEPIKESQ